MLRNYAASKGLDVSAAGDLTQFSDADSAHSWGSDALRWAVGTGLMNGMGDGALNPRGTATRAQLAAMLQRFCALIAE